MIPGIDVSHWEGMVDWGKVKAAGIQFVYIKATQGARYIDPYLAKNCTGARAADVPFGLYHVFVANEGPEQFVNWKARLALCKPDLPSWLDIEPGALTDETAPQALAMLQEAFQPTDCVYCSPSTAQAFLSDPGFQKYRLAIAHYTEAPSPNTVLWPGWLFWQHSAVGKVDGIETAVDLDWFNGSLEDLQKLISVPVT